MQVENEYGSYGDDKAYLAALADMLRERGVDVPLVTSDGPEHDMLACGKCEGVFQTGNFGSQTQARFGFMAEQGISAADVHGVLGAAGLTTGDAESTRGRTVQLLPGIWGNSGPGGMATYTCSTVEPALA